MIKRGLSYFRTHTFSKIILSFVAILAFGLSLLGTFSYTAYRSSLLESAVENSRSRTKLIMERMCSRLSPPVSCSGKAEKNGDECYMSAAVPASG